jgi:hypothetical protein
MSTRSLTPALRTLAHPGLEADEFLLALGCRPDQHQHAFGGLFHPGGVNKTPVPMCGRPGLTWPSGGNVGDVAPELSRSVPSSRYTWCATNMRSLGVA